MRCLFGSFPRTRDDVSLNRLHLLRFQDLLEGRHAERGTFAAQDDVLDSLERRLAGIAQIGQRSGDSFLPVAGRTVGREKKLSLMHDLR